MDLDEKEFMEKIIREIIFYETFIFRDMILNINKLTSDMKLNLIDRYESSKLAYKVLVKNYK